MPFELATCPYCGYAECEADWVDVEVGYIQCGPYYCLECGASQIGPEGRREGLTEEEERKRWYKPGSPVSPLANTFKGIPVNHKMAKSLYNAGLLDPKPDDTETEPT